LSEEYNLEGVSIATCDELENVLNDQRWAIRRGSRGRKSGARPTPIGPPYCATFEKPEYPWIAKQIMLLC
jgi:hypothetical protein